MKVNWGSLNIKLAFTRINPIISFITFDSMKQLVVTALLLMTVLGTGVAQTRKTLDSWIGHTRKELYKQWSLPDREGGDGEGGYIIAYRTRDMRGEKWTSFYLDGKNIIRSWSTKPIPPKVIHVKPEKGWDFSGGTYRTPN